MNRLLTSLADSGTFAVLAVDHGQSFRRNLSDSGLPSDPEFVLALKLLIVGALGQFATAVVAEPGPMIEQVVRNGLIPRDVGLIVGLPDITAKSLSEVDVLARDVLDEAVAFGCDAVKWCFVVDGRADIPRIVDAARRAVAFSHEAGIAAIVEAVPHPRSRDFAAYRDVAQSLNAVGSDLLKLPFPLAAGSSFDEHDQCFAVTNLVRSQPWVLLSAGVEFTEFRRRVEVACRAGASGFVAGTAIWQEVLALKTDRLRSSFLHQTASQRIRSLREAASASKASAAGTYD